MANVCRYGFKKKLLPNLLSDRRVKRRSTGSVHPAHLRACSEQSLRFLSATRFCGPHQCRFTEVVRSVDCGSTGEKNPHNLDAPLRNRRSRKRNCDGSDQSCVSVPVLLVNTRTSLNQQDTMSGLAAAAPNINAVQPVSSAAFTASPDARERRTPPRRLGRLLASGLSFRVSFGPTNRP